MYKSSHDKVLTRMLEIISMMKQDIRPTKEELYKQFEVSKRTIERDIARFEVMQYGILKDTNGRYYTEESLKKYSKDELSTLYLSMVIIKDAGSLFHKSAKSILEKSLPSEFSTAYHIASLPIEFLDMESTISKTIKEAIEYSEKILIDINYKKIMIEPYKIKPLRGLWYLIGFEEHSKEIKPYRLNHIQMAKPNDKTFRVPLDIDEIVDSVVSPFFDDDKLITIRIKVNSNIADHFNSVVHLKTQHLIQTYTDGSLLIEYDVTHEEDIDNTIKAWLPDIEVLEPVWYKEKLINELESYLLKIKKESVNLTT